MRLLIWLALDALCLRNRRRCDDWQTLCGCSSGIQLSSETNDSRHLITSADVGRVTNAYLGRRKVLAGGFVRSYLDLLQHCRCGARLSGRRECETAQSAISMCPKMTRAAVNGQNEMKRRVSYMSVDRKAKSIRHRCIRVAEIIIVSTQGVTNICVTERNKK